MLPEVAISHQLGYFCDLLGVKKLTWRVGYFVAILENELILELLLEIYIFFARICLQLTVLQNDFGQNRGYFCQIWAKIGYFLPNFCGLKFGCF